MLSEIPLAISTRSFGRRRFSIKGQKVEERRKSPSSPSHRDEERSFVPSTADVLMGAASACSLISSSSHDRFVGCLTTSSLPHNPSVIVLSLMVDSAISTSVEIDLSDAGLEGPPVRIESFTQGEDSIFMAIFDAQANILTFSLLNDRSKKDGLVPSSDNLEVLSMQSKLKEIGYDYSGAELHSSMITMLSPSLVLIGIPPYFGCLNIYTQSFVPWSESLTRSRMTNNSITAAAFSAMFVGSFMSSTSSAYSDESSMPAVSAVTAVRVKEGLYFVFTLHADMSLRRWKFDTSCSSAAGGMAPVSVSKINVNLPEPDWSSSSSSPNAVALRSRLYEESTVALAVHVQTVASFERACPCFIAVLDLQTIDDNEDDVDSDGRISVIPTVLTIPSNVVSLIDFDFSARGQRCSLSTIFRSQSDPGTHVILYPPSLNAILSAEPVYVDSDFTLDGIAWQEQQRMISLSMPSRSHDDERIEKSSLEAALHEVDTFYLKYLFRPIYPRGTATMTGPSAPILQQAFAKSLKGVFKFSFASPNDRSLEAATLCAIHEWRRADDRKSGSLSVLADDQPMRDESDQMQLGSIYTSFASPSSKSSVGNQRDKSERIESMPSGVDEVRLHEERWQHLIRTVGKEEMLLRAPLKLSITAFGQCVLVRGGIVSMLVPSNDGNTMKADHFTSLDEKALKLIARIENSLEQRRKLESIETDLLRRLSDVLPLLGEENRLTLLSPLLNALVDLSNWANETQKGQIFDRGELSKEAHSIDRTAIVEWLNHPHANDLPRLERASPLNDRTSFPYQIRNTTAILVVQGLNSARRLALGRCLLFSSIENGQRHLDDLLRSYLHCLGLLWSCAQRALMPSDRSRGFEQSIENPRAKRLSYGAMIEPESLVDDFSASAKTTILDCRILQALESTNSSSKSISWKSLAQVVIAAAFGFESSSDLSNAKKFSSLCRDIGILPRPSSEFVATDHPWVALRLLLPRSLFPSDDENGALAIIRKETLAECILIEASRCQNDVHVMQLREKASAMLVPVEERSRIPFDVQHRVIDISLRIFRDRLTRVNESEAESRDHALDPEAAHSSMEGATQRFLHGDFASSKTRPDVGRLCSLQFFRNTFLPFYRKGIDVINSGFDPTEREHVKTLFSGLLTFSNDLHYLSVLERQLEGVGCVASSDAGELMTTRTRSTIVRAQEMFPSDVLSMMPEYLSLFSRLYRYAELTENWMIAQWACLLNPSVATKVEGLRQLVVAMVNAGCLDSLASLCFWDAGSGSEEIDLYELAGETLTDLENEIGGLIPLDPLGCLFALHVMKRQWKRAAEVANLRCFDAENELLESSSKSNGGTAFDIALSSLATLNALQLIPQESMRFIVSGKFDSLPWLPAVDEGEPQPKSILKRGRDSIKRNKQQSRSTMTKEYMGLPQLTSRAIQAMVVNVLLKESSSNREGCFRVIKEADDDETIQGFFDRLGQLGYFYEAFLVARCEAMRHESGNRTAYDVSHRLCCTTVNLLCQHVVPLILNANPINEGFHSNWRLTHLHREIDEFSNKEKCHLALTCAPRGVPLQKLEDANTAVAAMELLRQVTTGRSSSIMPIAIELAECFLSVDANSTRVPLWLENLLCGKDEGKVKGMNGADPCALMSLYLKFGLHGEACDVACDILATNAATKPESRLPEKGDLTFIPHGKIDCVWQSIEDAMRNGMLDTQEEERLLHARARMESALSKHFALARTSEQGAKSARILIGS